MTLEDVGYIIETRRLRN